MRKPPPAGLIPGIRQTDAPTRAQRNTAIETKGPSTPASRLAARLLARRRGGRRRF